MKTHCRLTLPPIVDGGLIAKTAMQDGHDIYNSITIEDDSSDKSDSSDEEAIIEENFLSPASSFFNAAPRRKFKRTFKGIASAIVAQSGWAKQARLKWEAELTGISNVNEQSQSKALTFNAKAFKSHIQACGEITPVMKLILRKFSKYRTEEEIKLMGKIVKRLKVFDKYPQMIKEELGRILYYDVFEDGRLISKQGQSGLSFYFIVSGTVAVERIEVDKKTGIRHMQKVDELGEGDSFGELVLLHSNTKRAASMICRGSCQFLRIDRSEFEDVLQICREKEWQQRAKVLGELKPFSVYSPRDLMVLNSHAKLETYPPNTVILENLKQKLDRVYIVVSGSCNIVRELIVIRKELSNKNYKYILPPHDFVLKVKAGEMLPMKTKYTVEKHFLVIDTLRRGDAFNTCESMADLFFISNRKTEVMNMAMSSLGKPLENFEKIKDEFTRSIPSREETFDNFVAELKWAQYKRTLIRQVLTKSSKGKRGNRGQNLQSKSSSRKQILQ